MIYWVLQEGDVFVARCLDVEVASDGPTEAAAVAALKEALELYYEDSKHPPSANGGETSPSGGSLP